MGIWTIQLGALLFQAIDRTFPNPTLDFANGAWVLRGMADELAGIIVAFPLFLFLSRWIVRGVKQQPERLESPVRKWLTYIALVITASTMIADIVTFLAYFLRGDLSTRFALKVVTVLVIAAGVFAYYLDSLRGDTVSPTRNRWFTIAALAMVAFGLIAGFVQIGSPTVRRSVSEDAHRLFDLSSLAQGLHDKWQVRGQNEFGQKGFLLHATIQSLPAAGLPPGVSISDPVSGRIYEYTPLQGTAYRLCADFSRPSPAEVPSQWRHPAGRACFGLDAAESVALVQREW